MSQKKRNKAIRDKYSMTAKEAEAQGLIPKDFHLFDSIDMKEYQAKFPGYKEWEKGLKQDEDFYGPNKSNGV